MMSFNIFSHQQCRPIRVPAFLFFVCILSFVGCKKSVEKNELRTSVKQPNIIYILADDLGYGELGSYGQEKIETPNLDALAKSGMKFTQHYSSAPVCAPARYMLLTGKHSGHAYIRGNDEWSERGEVWNYKAVVNDQNLEGQRPIPAQTILFPQKLKEIGYATAIIGKWGLGAPNSPSIPTKMGFDFFYGYNCQRQAHTYYPVHLYKNEQRVYLPNDTIAPGFPLADGADPLDEASYKKYSQQAYAPDLMYNEMINFVTEQKDKPFFLYWASPLPHVALQAPKRWVDYYVEKFGEEEPYLGKSYFPTRYPRATYAAMISYLDENVGKLIAQLKKAGIYENTLIVFTSDNGPTYAGGADPRFFNSGGEFEEVYGKGKGFVYEGGIRVPMIASWPGHIEPGSETALPSTQYDVAATIAELTGYTMSENDGISFLPTLLNDVKGQKQHEFLFWEFPEYGGQVAIRMGDWKVIRQHLTDQKTATLEVYNLKSDPLELTNVANQHPEVLARAAAIFAEQHEDARQERFRIPLIEQGLLTDKKAADSFD